MTNFYTVNFYACWLCGDSVSETDSLLETDENALETQQTFGVSTQTELTFTAMQEELDRCHQTIQSLTERLSMARFSEDSSKWQDLEILYWLTKLQCAETSFWLHCEVYTCIVFWFNKADIFSGVYDWMVKLWSNCQDLAQHYGVSCSTISRILLKWMTAMDGSLHNLILWPDHESLCKTMPDCFPISFGTKLSFGDLYWMTM